VPLLQAAAARASSWQLKVEPVCPREVEGRRGLVVGLAASAVIVAIGPVVSIVQP